MYRSTLALLLVGTVSSVLALPTNDQTSHSLIITSTQPGDWLDGCLRESYYGAYGSAQEHVYIPSTECLLSQIHPMHSSGSGVLVGLDGIDDPQSRLIWVGQAGVQGVTDGVMEGWQVIQDRVSTLFSEQINLESSQSTFTTTSRLQHTRPITLIHGSETSLILNVPYSFLLVLDTLLPRHLASFALPTTPLPDTFSPPGWKSVPEFYTKHLANITNHLEFDPKLDQILTEGIQVDEIRRSVRWLTGEAPSGIISRHSFTSGAIIAAKWIKAKVEATGATCIFQTFAERFAPNIVCEYPSTSSPNDHTILSAHYDSHGIIGIVPAPGGNDDGSGSGHLLAIAEAIKDMRVKFEKPVMLIFFAGEEQSGMGSAYFAKHFYDLKMNITLNIQADRLAYHVPGEPMQLALPKDISTPEASYLVGNISQLYSPELVVGTTPVCCSDHQNFLKYGYPATMVNERNGEIADPMYHNPGDVSVREGYDFEQIRSIAKVTLGTAMTVAGWSQE